MMVRLRRRLRLLLETAARNFSTVCDMSRKIVLWACAPQISGTTYESVLRSANMIR